MTQLLFGLSVPFEKLTEVLPELGAGENAPAPHPLNATPGVVLTTTLLGKVSLKFTPVKVTFVGFLRVMVITEEELGDIDLGEKVLLMVTLEASMIFA
jgi:hypothetical protein